MNGRGYMQGPQGGGGYNPYSKYPDIGGLVQQFMQNMMMKKQMEQQRGQQEWQRGMEEKKLESLEAYREAQTKAMQQPQKPPTIPAGVQEAIIGSGQGGVRREDIDWSKVGQTLNKWKAKPGKPLEPGITKPRKTWLDKLDKDIDGMIKNITAMPAYGMDEELTVQVGNLQQAKTKIRGALAIGADQLLPDALWGELGGISERLKEIQKKGLHPPKPKPLMKGKLPRKKKSELPAGTEIKWNPKLNIRMAKIDGVWHWVIE